MIKHLLLSYNFEKELISKASKLLGLLNAVKSCRAVSRESLRNVGHSFHTDTADRPRRLHCELSLLKLRFL
jgi:hypothetical protein